MIDAYLDIETTGLSRSRDTITVIGIYLVNGHDAWLVQLVGDHATQKNLLKALDGVGTVFTYNGRRFDLPFIHACTGINLETMFCHQDLMFACWRNGLYGGFKAVEQHLGIPRQLTEIDGLEAVRLWWKYVRGKDEDALRLLLRYNEEDVVNLKSLREYFDEQTG